MTKIELHCGKNKDVLALMPDNSIDSIVTDPPYELGFMGKKWDSTGIAYDVELWRECLRVLKPGGHLLAFSGTRTYHRMAVAIEDAGFEVRDMIEWVYGSGFPKSLNIGKAVDKLQGNEREWVGKNPAWRKGNGDGATTSTGWAKPQRPDKDKGTSEYEGWGTALKPAHEPICMARKPLSEKNVAENCLKWGTGGINVDGSRVAFQNDNDIKRMERPNCIGKNYGTIKGGETFLSGDIESISNLKAHEQGRFPANLIHDGSEEVRACFPETKNGGKLNAERQNKGSGGEKTGNIYGVYAPHKTVETYGGDSGNASRFFKSIIYQAKASKAERGEGNFHPTVKPVALMEYLINMVTPPNGTVLDPFMGSGTTGVACKLNGFGFVGIDMIPDHVEIAKRRINFAKPKAPTLF
jgi:DNA modification methylase